MEREEYAVVMVRVEKENDSRKAVCYPDGVNLYWNGPRKIRWVFQDIPADISNVAITFFDHMPGKYGDKPITPIPPRDFDAPQTQASSTSGSKLKDVVVVVPGQHDKKYFFYEVRLTGTGKEIVRDPGGTDQPDWPPLPFPP